MSKKGAVRKEQKPNFEISTKKDTPIGKKSIDPGEPSNQSSTSAQESNNVRSDKKRKRSLNRHDTYNKSSLQNDRQKDSHQQIFTSKPGDLRKNSTVNKTIVVKTSQASTELLKTRQLLDKKRVKNLDTKSIIERKSKISKPTLDSKVKESTKNIKRSNPSVLQTKISSDTIYNLSNRSETQGMTKKYFYSTDNSKLSTNTTSAYSSLEKSNEESRKIHEKENSEVETDNEYTYEDDFEDYESDFQECTDSEVSLIHEDSSSDNEIEMRTKKTLSKKEQIIQNKQQKVEEEHMLDSGHFDLSEAKKKVSISSPRIMNYTQKNLPSQITTTRDDKLLENKSLPLSMDEGFEDSRSGEFEKPSTQTYASIDFQKLKENKLKKEKKKNRNRGDELLEMIKLDIMGWSLFECAPIPYDEFIRNYGKLNTRQISTETRENNLDIEVQTDEILYTNKWTQFPVACRKTFHNNDDINLFKMEHIGVGDDESFNSNKSSQTPFFHIVRLSEFLSRASAIILSVLSKNSCIAMVNKSESQEIPSSDGYCELLVNSVPYLSERKVLLIHYANNSNKVLLTIHAPADEEIETSSKEDYILDSCIGCVWNISESSIPLYMFYSPCLITDCIFHIKSHNIIFGGLEDGSICIWDLKEDETWHNKIKNININLEYTIRTITFTTAGNPELVGHNSKIVALRTLSKKPLQTKNFNKIENKFQPIQICSLDEEGCIIIWSVLRNVSMRNNINNLPWSNIILIKSQQIEVSSYRKITNKINCFIDMHVEENDINSIYIVTDSNYILKVNSMTNKVKALIYNDEEIEISTNVVCMKNCSFGSSYFLMGCDNGLIRLHSLNVKKSLLQLKCTNPMNKIIALQWCKSRPFNIYALDSSSRLYMWDLKNSNIYPTYTTTTQEWGHVCCMKLSPCQRESDINSQYLTLGMASGNVRLYKLNHELRTNNNQQEDTTFTHYITIL